MFEYPVRGENNLLTRNKHANETVQEKKDPHTVTMYMDCYMNHQDKKVNQSSEKCYNKLF